MLHFKIFFYGTLLQNIKLQDNLFSFLDKPSESNFPPFRGRIASCSEDSPRGKSGIKEEIKVRLLPLYKICHIFFIFILLFSFLLEIHLLHHLFRTLRLFSHHFSFLFFSFLLSLLLSSILIISLFLSTQFFPQLYSITNLMLSASSNWGFRPAITKCVNDSMGENRKELDV